MATTKKVSAYKMNVLNTNKALKRECKSLGGAVKVLWLFREEIELSTQYIQILSQIRENDDVYATFKENVRVSKAGNYSPFFVLQAIHKALKNKDEVTQDLTPIEKMNVAQLKEVAKKQGKTKFSKMNKAQLVELVTA